MCCVKCVEETSTNEACLIAMCVYNNVCLQQCVSTTMCVLYLQQ